MRFSLKFLATLSFLTWVGIAGAVSLGSPQLLSQPGEPLRVEIPIRIAAGEKTDLESLKAVMPSKEMYGRLGISSKVLDFNAQSMVYRNAQDKLMVLVETVTPIPVSEDPFVDILVNLNWSSGSITKTVTLLLGDAKTVVVRPGQSLSEIAAQMAPQLDGATLDQAMLALYKANPDAFASGSINKLESGAQLIKPSQALLRSISPADANQFVAQAYADSHASQPNPGNEIAISRLLDKNSVSTSRDRLKIDSSTEGNAEEKRYTEELVTQEKELEQTRAKVAELEKNIADLQQLIDKNKETKGQSSRLERNSFGPGLLALGLIGFTALLLWFLARNARRSESTSTRTPAVTESQASDSLSKPIIPDRAKALLAGIDLNLSKPTPKSSTQLEANSSLANALRVKLNLARAYITIEDFSAAKKSLDEVILRGASVDPSLAIEARALIAQLSQRTT